MTPVVDQVGQPGRGKRLSVAVVQGGPSTEAEVSRASAKGVAHALESVGHRVVRLELDAHLGESLRTGGYEVVFPVAHGAVGEDGSLQGLLEVLDLPYVGSDVLASSVAMHKRISRVLLQQAGLPVAKGIVLRRGESLASAERARREVGARLVVKPSSHGSAIGVSRLDASASLNQLARALELVWEMDEYAIVERFAPGREVTCGVLELDDVAVALPPTEIVCPHDLFYTYEARYAPGRSIHVCPAKLPAELISIVQRQAIAAHAALGCRDLSRVDFIVGGVDGELGGADGDPRNLASEDTVTLLELNTLPGMTATSLYPEEAAAFGLPMPTLCDGLVARAHARGATRRLAARPLPC